MPKTFAADFRAEKSQEELRRKTNDRRCPLNLGPRILKIVVFVARRRLLHPHFGLGSNANVFYYFICCVTSEPEMRVKESSASYKTTIFRILGPIKLGPRRSFVFCEVLPDLFRP